MYAEVFEKARLFIYRNARPLDIARWHYHFQGGGREAVLEALAAYQNEDGGFGHALEPDAWNLNSAPIQTWAATELLREIGMTDAAHPIIRGILRYLASGKDFDGRFWFNTVAGNNDYPHAPWWHVGNQSAQDLSYNPTACLAGFIIRFADKEGELHRLGRRLAKEAAESYFRQDSLEDMHTAACYVRLWQYCAEAGAGDVIDLAALRERLRGQVSYCITKDTARWDTDYICKPSQFFNARSSFFYADNQETADYECAFIVNSQLADGSWDIPWSWGDYPEQWAISKNWWKGNGAILNMLYLKGFGKLDQAREGRGRI